MAEIDDARLAGLEQAANVLDRLIKSNKTSRRQHELIKEEFPDHRIPIDPSEIVEKSEAAAKRVLEQDKAAAAKAKLESDFQRDLDSYRLSASNPDGFTDEGIEKIKKYMWEKGIADVHAAVAGWEKLNPPPTSPPSGYMPTGWNFGARGDDDKKLLFEDPDAWADKEARKVWEEHRKADAV